MLTFQRDIDNVQYAFADLHLLLNPPKKTSEWFLAAISQLLIMVTLFIELRSLDALYHSAICFITGAPF